jgi:HEPN domain-containing protein
METVRHSLMLRESAKRFAAADVLRAAGDESDSAYLLQLIGFELLLKVVVERATGKEAHGHDYFPLFNRLPQETQANLLQMAGQWAGPSALATNHEGVLTDLGSNFVKLRYPHEKYSSLTHEQYRNVGNDWVTRGSNSAEADFRYHPEELRALTLALREIADAS